MPIGVARPGRQRVWRTTLVALAAVVAGCGSSPSTGSSSSDGAVGSGDTSTVTLSGEEPVATGSLYGFEAVEGELVERLTSDLPVEVDVVTRDGGSILATRDSWDRPALLFPPFTGAAEPQRAIVRVVARGETDPLSPGGADFAFGADFAVDTASEGTEVDGGNNIVQRGLASDISQFKIEVDELRPLCRIQGPEGVVELRAERPVDPERWYRVRCSRTGATVQLLVSRLGTNAATLVEEVREDSPVGDLEFEPGTPLSVGGKLAANGSMIRSQTDQFNGLLADPVLKIGG